MRLPEDATPALPRCDTGSVLKYSCTVCVCALCVRFVCVCVCVCVCV